MSGGKSSVLVDPEAAWTQTLREIWAVECDSLAIQTPALLLPKQSRDEPVVLHQRKPLLMSLKLGVSTTLHRLALERTTSDGAHGFMTAREFRYGSRVVGVIFKWLPLSCCIKNERCKSPCTIDEMDGWLYPSLHFLVILDASDFSQVKNLGETVDFTKSRPTFGHSPFGLDEKGCLKFRSISQSPYDFCEPGGVSSECARDRWMKNCLVPYSSGGGWVPMHGAQQVSLISFVGTGDFDVLGHMTVSALISQTLSLQFRTDGFLESMRSSRARFRNPSHALCNHRFPFVSLLCSNSTGRRITSLAHDGDPPPASRQNNDEKSEIRCVHCRRTFQSTSNLRRHERALHEPGNGFSCHICGRVFSQRSNLKRHLRSVHERRRDFQCSICRSFFATEGNLARHKKKFHGLRMV